MTRPPGLFEQAVSILPIPANPTGRTDVKATDVPL